MRLTVLRSRTVQILSKVVFVVLSFAFLLPLYGSEAGGPCTPRVSFSSPHAPIASDGTVHTEVTVENIGTGTCSVAYLSLYYPEGVRYMSSVPEPKSGDYYWNFEALGSGEKSIVRLILSVEDPSLAPYMLHTTLNAGNEDSEASLEILPTLPESGSGAIASPLPAPSTRPAPITSSGSSLCSPREEKGMWVWNTPRGMSEAWRVKLLDSMAGHGFNTAYIDGSELWELDAKPEPERTAELEAFRAGLQAFVAAARYRGIAVEVTFGYRDWGEPANRWKPLRIIDQVLSYNASVPAMDRVCGVQSDIEPYLMDSYETDKQTVLGNYLETMDQLAKKVAASGSGTSLGIVIPHFYDPVQAWTPAITRGAVTQSAYEHVLDILSRVKKGSVSIMAYRNFLEGENGVIELVTPELRIAKERRAVPRVIIAQEVGCGLDPEWVSWCGSTKTVLEGAFATLRTAFRDNAWMGGFAVNYVDPYIDLTD